MDHWILSPRGNVRVGLTNQLNLRVGVSTGFRPPQVFDEDLHIAAVGGGGAVVRLVAWAEEGTDRGLTACSLLNYDAPRPGTGASIAGGRDTTKK